MQVLNRLNNSHSHRNLELIRTDELDKKTEGYRLLYNVLNTTPLAKDSYWAYNFALMRKEYKYTVEDIQEFYSDIRRGINVYHPTGKFISAAVNNVRRKNSNRGLNIRMPKIEVVLRNPNIKLDYIGERLSRNRTIIVHGNVGKYAAYANEGGDMIIDGNSGDELCSEMKSGEVVEFGNTERNAGHRMTGGRLVIFGGAESGVGADSGSMAQIIITEGFGRAINNMTALSWDPTDAIK